MEQHEEHRTAGFDREALRRRIADEEDALIASVLATARGGGYTRYTTGLLEAWRKAVRGLSASLSEALAHYEELPPIHIDEDLAADPCTAFGVREARLHRARGVELGMFLGMMKHFARSYLELIPSLGFAPAQQQAAHDFVRQFFDRVEIGFCTEWASCDEAQKLRELQSQLRVLTLEKSHFLTIFESLSTPVLYVDAKGALRNWNHAAGKIAGLLESPGQGYYSADILPKRYAWLLREIAEFQSSDKDRQVFEEEFSCALGLRHFQVQLQRMLDVGATEAGTLAILYDVTRLHHAERRLCAARAELEAELHDRERELEAARAAAAASAALLDVLTAQLAATLACVTRQQDGSTRA